MSENDNTTDYITLKWGTLKAWHVHSEKCLDILRRYTEAGVSMSAIAQHDTADQKTLLCELIDECNATEIQLDWDNKYVSKKAAKKYVLEYGSD